MPRIGDVPSLVSAAAQEFWAQIQTLDKPPLPEITLINASGKKTLMVIQAPTLKEAAQSSHEMALKMSQTVALCIEVCDGYETTDGVRSDAILIRVWVEGRGPIFLAQRYRRDPFELVGRAVVDSSGLER